MSDTPKYEHDCNSCRFLGSFTYDAPLADRSTIQMTVDLYHCRSSNGKKGTLLSRESDEPSDYASTMVEIVEDYEFRTAHCTSSPALIEALRRGRAEGLFK